MLDILVTNQLMFFAQFYTTLSLFFLWFVEIICVLWKWILYGYVGCVYLSLLGHVLFDPVVSFDTQKFLNTKKFEFLGIVALCPVFA